MQHDHTLANRSERIRNRAFLHLKRTGDLDGYWRLVHLGLEAHTIRDTSDWQDADED